MAIHSSILAGIILWTEEPEGLHSMGLQRNGHNRAWKHLTLLTKISLKWIKDLNKRHKTKNLREGLWGNILTLVLAIFFSPLDLTQKVQAIMAKINKWNFIKLKASSQWKNQSAEMKRQRTEWEKIFSNHVSNKGLIFITYKELIQLNSNNNQSQLKIEQENWIDIQLAIRYLKRWSLIIKKMQIKTAMRYYLTIIRLATIKKEMTSAGEDMGEKVPLGFVGWNANWYSHYGK